MKNLSTAQSRLSRAMFFAAAFLLAALFPAASRAMLVSLTLTYDAQPLATANLQVGSIVQVIAYNTATGEGDWRDGNAIDNFLQYGRDSEVYLPDTTPDNHCIVYTGHIQLLDGDQYGIVTDFAMDNSFNALYVRVFAATEFPQGQAIYTNWGLSEPVSATPTLGHYSYNVSNIAATHTNYFEVVPEPATLSLTFVGTAALAAFRRNRNRKGKGVRS